MLYEKKNTATKGYSSNSLKSNVRVKWVAVWDPDFVRLKWVFELSEFFFFFDFHNILRKSIEIRKIPCQIVEKMKYCEAMWAPHANQANLFVFEHYFITKMLTFISKI